MGNRALQDIKGVIRMVFLRSLIFSKDLEAMIAGTVQPKPNNIGINALPDKPILPMIPSIT